ncbi:MAG TPA: SRPBCC family protein [Rugosimonospora sp.]|nr:SRPBCC family protein [Rugosimonospora sp.]
MRDLIDELRAVHRETGARAVGTGEAKAVVLRREYQAPIEDVWDAITDPERIGRWFLPVSGDLRLGGRYQLKGNAGGEIRRCEPPRVLAVTWVFGEQAEGDVSEVRVRLSPGAEGVTALELEHVATVPPDRWSEFGPGAVGVGWDLALLGLALHLASGAGMADPVAWMGSAEGRGCITTSSEAWGDALKASGAEPDAVETAVRNTTNFYAPPPR